MSLTQIYTPGMITIPITGAATLVHVTHATSGAQNGQVCVAFADVTAGTLTINSGTWDGSMFTADATNPRKAYISAPSGETVCALVGFVTPAKVASLDGTDSGKVPALQFINTGSHAHVRIEGVTKQVLP